MPGTLFVVATPIGNLEDITHRALRILREVAIVAAEDTRRSGNLLRHFDIHTPLLSLHEHNEHERIGELLRRLQRGESVAVVSDAGTPGVADPGGRLVAAARGAGIEVQPVPGASAIAAVLSASGWDASRFVFAGYVPIRSTDRNDWVGWVKQAGDVPVVFFEAPHRIAKTLADFAVFFGERPILLGRELTKLHESWLQGSAKDILGALGQPQGEYVGILGPMPAAADDSQRVDDAEIAAEFGRITENGAATRREAIKLTARRLGLAANMVYEALERHKNSGK
jgi:16S rRNA (cytidine1402-2'-O)-methyltransferase